MNVFQKQSAKQFLSSTNCNLFYKVFQAAHVFLLKNGREVSDFWELLNFEMNGAIEVNVTIQGTGEKNIESSSKTNYIRTTKYTLWSFLPLQIYHQLCILSNIFFLLTSVLAFLPGISPLDPITATLPLIFVLVVAILRNAYEEYQRYRADKSANSAPISLFSRQLQSSETELNLPLNHNLYHASSSDLRVGDVILLRKNGEIMADVAMLYSSGNDNIAYIDTSHLDGEATVKLRRGKKWFNDKMLSYSSKILDDNSHSNANKEYGDFPTELQLKQLYEVLHSCSMRFRVEAPSPTLMFWNGLLEAQGKTFSLTVENLLYRGSVLRHTSWVVGVVVYTGWDTKLFRNLKPSRPPKVSSLDKKLNFTLAFILLLHQILLTALALTAAKKESVMSTNAWYIYPTGEAHNIMNRNAFVDFISRYMTYFVLLSYMIPVSLFVTLEVCKAVQGYYINQDPELSFCDKVSGYTRQSLARTTNLNEQLSQVKHVFTDKTGTLTENVMHYVGGTIQNAYCMETVSRASSRRDTNDSGGRSPGGSVRCPANNSILIRPDRNLSIGKLLRTPSTLKHSPLPMNDTIFESPIKITIACESLYWRSLALCNQVLPLPKGLNRAVLQENKNSSSLSDSRIFRALFRLWDIFLQIACVSTYKRHEETVHQSLPSTEDLKDERYPRELAFEGHSPDEIALVKGAANHGVTLIHRDEFISTVAVEAGEIWENSPVFEAHEKRINGQIESAAAFLSSSFSYKFEKYVRVAELEFTPQRKMMSTVLRDPNGRLIMFTKGADSSVLPIIFPCENEEHPSPQGRAIDVTRQALHEFGTCGLRTLVFAYKYLEEDDFSIWDASYQDALQTLDTVERQEKIDLCCKSLEKDMSLLGTTAIEDRLQDGVPETIKSLRQAGIDVWLLTGDMRETALNVASQSGLVNWETDDIIHVGAENSKHESMSKKIEPLLPQERNGNECSFDGVQKQLEDICKTYPVRSINKCQIYDENLSYVDDELKTCLGGVCLVVNGPSVQFIIENHLRLLLDVSRRISSVVCCRLTPLQKSSLVRAIQRGLHTPAQGKRRFSLDQTCEPSSTPCPLHWHLFKRFMNRIKRIIDLIFLYYERHITSSDVTAIAVGDGANDVSMIQEAKVGIGIMGREGSQAVLASDYALPRFRHLKRLLFVHGRYALYRNATCIGYSFYKNLLLSFCQIFYAWFAACSGTTMFDSWLLVFFNLFFTSLIPLSMGM